MNVICLAYKKKNLRKTIMVMSRYKKYVYPFVIIIFIFVLHT